MGTRQSSLDTRDRTTGAERRQRTYRAGSLREALAQVRRDLGGGAVILGTREVRKRRLLGLGRRDLVEVTACAEGGRGPKDRGNEGPLGPGPKTGT